VRLAFARLHLGDTAVIEADAAEDLNIVVTHVHLAPTRFADQRIAFGQKGFERLATLGSVDQGQEFFTELRVAERFAVFFPAVDGTGLHEPLIDLISPHAGDFPACGDVRSVGELQRDVFSRIGRRFVVHTDSILTSKTRAFSPSWGLWRLFLRSLDGRWGSEGDLEGF
jgi:hypothetical protein